MMPTIRIDDEVWKALKESAEPFVDTPNDVLRRLLLPKKPAEASSVMLMSLLEEGGKQTSVIETKRRGPKSHVERTGEAAFRLPILQALVELGGQGSVGEVLEHARKHLKSELKPDDIKTLKSNGEVRWENTAKWERKHLLDDGLLDSSAPHGIWRITPLGRDYLKNSESL